MPAALWVERSSSSYIVGKRVRSLRLPLTDYTNAIFVEPVKLGVNLGMNFPTLSN
jgi:hypothetical protein